VALKAEHLLLQHLGPALCLDSAWRAVLFVVGRSVAAGLLQDIFKADANSVAVLQPQRAATEETAMFEMFTNL
jgi:hypothetical protein